MKKILCVLYAFLISTAYLHGDNINWSLSPTMISGSNVNASNAQVAIDHNGNAVAVWVENNLIKASTKPVNGNWTPGVSISNPTASKPCVAVDANGNAVAVWIENGAVRTASKSSGNNWTNPTSLSNSGASSPSLCVSAAGDFIAAWARGGNVETSTKLHGNSNWQARNTIASASAANPTVAIGGSGNSARAVIVWQGTSCGNNVIFASTKLIIGSWGAGQVISDASHSAVQPFAAVDVNSNALAIWYEYDLIGNSYANVIVKSAGLSSLTGAWSSSTDLSEPGLRNPATLNAALVFDGIGNAIALWNISFDDQTFNLQSAIKPVNAGWSSAQDLIEPNLYAFSSNLAATAFGDVLGLYMFYNGNAIQIQSVESGINGYLNNFWSVPINISLGADNAYPKIAASLVGNEIHAVAVWGAYNGSHNYILASTGSKLLVLPPTDLSVTQSQQNYFLFSQYYNTLQWTQSVDPNVVGYLIFRNGQFIAQVDASVTQYVDNNRVQNGAVTYAVAAINAEQTQSVMATASFP